MNVTTRNSTLFPNYTRDSLLARYANPKAGPGLESLQHFSAAEVIQDVLTAEKGSLNLIGEDCQYIDVDKPGQLTTTSPDFVNGTPVCERTDLRYDPETMQVKSFQEARSSAMVSTRLPTW